MIRFPCVVLTLLAFFAACSKQPNPLAPVYGSSLPVDSLVSPAARPSHEPEIWAAVDVVLDPLSQEAVLVRRGGDLVLRHYKVNYFLTPPFCETCIFVTDYEADKELGTGSFLVTVMNPTGLWGYDVRAVIRIPLGQPFKLLNADGYTNLFPMDGYQSPAPFITFAKSLQDHGFAPGASHFEVLRVKTKPGTDPAKFTLLITAGHPAAPGDVSRIWGFRQEGQLLPAGDTAKVSFQIEDLQGDIGGVCLHAQQLGAGDVWLQPDGGGRWTAQLKNIAAGPGLYYLWVEAHSPNLQNAVTSHVFQAVVFHSNPSFRSQLLALVNSDRAKEGLPPLSADPLLDTVAQSHAQDMADRQYFSHYNLDGLSPWDRMVYYGVDFDFAGENIAVGQDTPSQVESDWMNSSGHKANILNSNFKKVGFGIVPTSANDPYNPGYYWVQVFSD